MIKTLKRKFILINMLLVFLVLAIVFSAILVITYNRLEKESDQLLSLALSTGGKPFDSFEFGKGPGANMLPRGSSYITVTLDGEGNILQTVYNNAEADNETLLAVARLIKEKGSERGIIDEYNLRYMVLSYSDGCKIALSDRSGEKNIMANLVGSSLLTGAGALAAFFLISVMLANLALKPAETAWEKQRRFIADASHELKTPLTVILADTDILLTHENDKISSQKNWVENTRQEALHMKTLVEDMLFLAKSDANRQQTLMTKVSLSDTAQAQALAFEAVAFEKNITLNTEAAEAGVDITADEKQIKQLEAILLDNACKYCNEGGTVSISVKREGNKALLKVKNTGSFISPEESKLIFERFYRSDFSRSREDGGYGLGLAIAKTICDMHKASISVSGDAGGTEFTVVFGV